MDRSGDEGRGAGAKHRADGAHAPPLRRDRAPERPHALGPPAVRTRLQRRRQLGCTESRSNRTLVGCSASLQRSDSSALSPLDRDPAQPRTPRKYGTRRGTTHRNWRCSAAGWRSRSTAGVADRAARARSPPADRAHVRLGRRIIRSSSTGIFTARSPHDGAHDMPDSGIREVLHPLAGAAGAAAGALAPSPSARSGSRGPRVQTRSGSQLFARPSRP